MKKLLLLILIISNINAENCKYFLIKEKKHKKIYKQIKKQIKNCDKNSTLEIISKNKKIDQEKEKTWWLYSKKKICYIKVDNNLVININNEIQDYKKKNKCKSVIMGIFEQNKLNF